MLSVLQGALYKRKVEDKDDKNSFVKKINCLVES